MGGNVPDFTFKSTNTFEHSPWRFLSVAYCTDRKFIYINFVEISAKCCNIVNHESDLYIDYLHCWHIV
jgi:hypothetical protein